MTLPDPPTHRRRIPPAHRLIVAAAVVGGGVCLFAVIVGLVVLGYQEGSSGEVAKTALAAIGATLAGGFASWIGREQGRRERDDGER
jgi:hypothetical protein